MPNRSETILDATGLRCPMPLLKTKQALNKMPIGSLLRVFATDSASQRDFETFSQQSGQKLISSAVDDDRYEFLFEKSEPLLRRQEGKLTADKPASTSQGVTAQEKGKGP